MGTQKNLGIFGLLSVGLLQTAFSAIITLALPSAMETASLLLYLGFFLGLSKSFKDSFVGRETEAPADHTWDCLSQGYTADSSSSHSSFTIGKRWRSNSVDFFTLTTWGSSLREEWDCISLNTSSRTRSGICLLFLSV